MELTFGTLVYMSINFLLLIYILKLILYKPIQGILEERRKKIRDDLNEAQKSRETYDTLSKEVRTTLEKARAEAFEIVERARAESDKLREDILLQARQEAEQLRQRNQGEIERAKRVARDELREGTVILALTAAQKVIGSKMSKDINENLIRNALDQIGKGATDDAIPGGI